MSRNESILKGNIVLILALVTYLVLGIFSLKYYQYQIDPDGFSYIAIAQWPPYSLKLTPSYDGDQITYDIKFSDKVDWKMVDVTISVEEDEGIPLLVQQTITQSGMVLAVPPTGDRNSVFMRRAFTISEPLPTQLVLRLAYDGGFIAYLNGTELARRNLGEAGSPIPFDTLATPDGRLDHSESIDLSSFISRLVTGTNVLAIQAHSADGTGLSVDPELTWTFNPLYVAEDTGSLDEPPTSASVSIGNRIAFVADHDGQWAIWVTPVAGGSAQKLFDLPSDRPWGDGSRSWLNERISWGS